MILKRYTSKFVNKFVIVTNCDLKRQRIEISYQGGVNSFWTNLSEVKDVWFISKMFYKWGWINILNTILEIPIKIRLKLNNKRYEINRRKNIGT